MTTASSPEVALVFRIRDEVSARLGVIEDRLNKVAVAGQGVARSNVMAGESWARYSRNLLLFGATTLSVAGSVANLAKSMGLLNEEQTKSVANFISTVGAIAAVAGGIARLIPIIIALTKAEKVRAIASAVANAMGGPAGLATLAIGAVAAVGAVALVNQLTESHQMGQGQKHTIPGSRTQGKLVMVHGGEVITRPSAMNRQWREWPRSYQTGIDQAQKVPTVTPEPTDEESGFSRWLRKWNAFGSPLQSGFIPGQEPRPYTPPRPNPAEPPPQAQAMVQTNPYMLKTIGQEAPIKMPGYYIPRMRRNDAPDTRNAFQRFFGLKKPPRFVENPEAMEVLASRIPPKRNEPETLQEKMAAVAKMQADRSKAVYEFEHPKAEGQPSRWTQILKALSIGTGIGGLGAGFSAVQPALRAVGRATGMTGGMTGSSLQIGALPLARGTPPRPMPRSLGEREGPAAGSWKGLFNLARAPAEDRASQGRSAQPVMVTLNVTGSLMGTETEARNFAKMIGRYLQEGNRIGYLRVG